MDLDDVERWRHGGNGTRDRYRARYTPQYGQRGSDAYQSLRDPAPRRQYFNDDDAASAEYPARRSAPPPPPPTPPSPAKGKRRSPKQTSRRRSSRRSRRASSEPTHGGSSDEATATGSTASTETATSADSSASTTTSDSYDYSYSESESSSASSADSTYSRSGSDSSTVSRPRHTGRQRTATPPRVPAHALQSLTGVVSRVSARPSTAAQDEEIAAAAACRAILEREAQLKEKELRLLQQKRNFAAEVQRRSSLPNRFAVEDEAIRHMQRLVDLENSTPAVQEYLRRTSKAALPAPPRAPTDAQALAYLRTYGGATEADGAAMPPSQRPTALPPPPKPAADTRKHGHDGDDDAAAAAASGEPAVVAASSAAALTAADSLLEHSLPLEGQHAAHPAPSSAPATEHGSAPAPTDAAAAPHITLETDRTDERAGGGAGISAEGSIAAAAAATDGAGAAATSQLRSDSRAPSRSASAERAGEPAAASGLAGDGHVIHVQLPQRRRLKVTMRRRRSRSRPHVQSQHTGGDGESDTEEEGQGEDGGAPAAPRGASAGAQPAAPQSAAVEQQQQPVQRQLLPPPPSPSSHPAAERQRIAVDPLHRYKQSNGGAGGAAAQPWAMTNWPCSAQPTTTPAKSKDGPPALWYASNSPVPLSHHEFKTLLCSEYVSPETTTALPAGVPGTTSAAAAGDGEAVTAGERDGYEPYSGGGGAVGAASAARSPAAGRGGRRHAGRRRSVRIHDADNAPDSPAADAVAADAAAAAAPDSGVSAVRTPPSHSPPPPAALAVDEGEAVVEFPPPPHMMAADMPPPGDVGSDGEDSCCGCSCVPCAGCCGCWTAMWSCLFPCCCGGKQAVAASPAAEPPHPLAFQRSNPQAAPPPGQPSPVADSASLPYTYPSATTGQTNAQGPQTAAPLPPLAPPTALPAANGTAAAAAPVNGAYTSGGTGNVLPAASTY